MKTKKIAATIMTMALAAMTSIPAFAGTWVRDEEDYSHRERYVNDDGTYLSNGWYWIDRDGDGAEECYYFDQDGWTTPFQKTPDGYYVNTIGAWIENGVMMKRGVATVDLSKAASLVGTYTNNNGYICTLTDNGDGGIRMTGTYDNGMPYSSVYYYSGENNYRGYVWVLETEEEKDSFVAGVGQIDDGALVRIG